MRLPSEGLRRSIFALALVLLCPAAAAVNLECVEVDYLVVVTADILVNISSNLCANVTTNESVVDVAIRYNRVNFSGNIQITLNLSQVVESFHQKFDVNRTRLRLTVSFMNCSIAAGAKLNIIGPSLDQPSQGCDTTKQIEAAILMRSMQVDNGCLLMEGSFPPSTGIELSSFHGVMDNLTASLMALEHDSDYHGLLIFSNLHLSCNSYVLLSDSTLSFLFPSGSVANGSAAPTFMAPLCFVGKLLNIHDNSSIGISATDFVVASNVIPTAALSFSLSAILFSSNVEANVSRHSSVAVERVHINSAQRSISVMSTMSLSDRSFISFVECQIVSQSQEFLSVVSFRRAVDIGVWSSLTFVATTVTLGNSSVLGAPARTGDNDLLTALLFEGGLTIVNNSAVLLQNVTLQITLCSDDCFGSLACPYSNASRATVAVLTSLQIVNGSWFRVENSTLDPMATSLHSMQFQPISLCNWDATVVATCLLINTTISLVISSSSMLVVENTSLDAGGVTLLGTVVISENAHILLRAVRFHGVAVVRGGIPFYLLGVLNFDALSIRYQSGVVVTNVSCKGAGMSIIMGEVNLSMSGSLMFDGIDATTSLWQGMSLLIIRFESLSLDHLSIVKVSSVTASESAGLASIEFVKSVSLQSSSTIVLSNLSLYADQSMVHVYQQATCNTSSLIQLVNTTIVTCAGCAAGSVGELALLNNGAFRTCNCRFAQRPLSATHNPSAAPVAALLTIGQDGIFSTGSLTLVNISMECYGPCLTVGSLSNKNANLSLDSGTVAFEQVVVNCNFDKYTTDWWRNGSMVDIDYSVSCVHFGFGSLALAQSTLTLNSFDVSVARNAVIFSSAMIWNFSSVLALNASSVSVRNCSFFHHSGSAALLMISSTFLIENTSIVEFLESSMSAVATNGSNATPCALCISSAILGGPSATVTIKLRSRLSFLNLTLHGALIIADPKSIVLVDGRSELQVSHTTVESLYQVGKGVVLAGAVAVTDGGVIALSEVEIVGAPLVLPGHLRLTGSSQFAAKFISVRNATVGIIFDDAAANGSLYSLSDSDFSISFVLIENPVEAALIFADSWVTTASTVWISAINVTSNTSHVNEFDLNNPFVVIQFGRVNLPVADQHILMDNVSSITISSLWLQCFEGIGPLLSCPSAGIVAILFNGGVSLKSQSQVTLRGDGSTLTGRFFVIRGATKLYNQCTISAERCRGLSGSYALQFEGDVIVAKNSSVSVSDSSVRFNLPRWCSNVTTPDESCAVGVLAFRGNVTLSNESYVELMNVECSSDLDNATTDPFTNVVGLALLGSASMILSGSYVVMQGCDFKLPITHGMLLGGSTSQESTLVVEGNSTIYLSSCTFLQINKSVLFLSCNSVLRNNSLLEVSNVSLLHDPSGSDAMVFLFVSKQSVSLHSSDMKFTRTVGGVFLANASILETSSLVLRGGRQHQMLECTGTLRADGASLVVFADMEITHCYQNDSRPVLMLSVAVLTLVGKSAFHLANLVFSGKSPFRYGVPPQGIMTMFSLPSVQLDQEATFLVCNMTLSISDDLLEGWRIPELKIFAFTQVDVFSRSTFEVRNIAFNFALQKFFIRQILSFANVVAHDSSRFLVSGLTAHGLRNSWSITTITRVELVQSSLMQFSSCAVSRAADDNSFDNFLVLINVVLHLDSNISVLSSTMALATENTTFPSSSRGIVFRSVNATQGSGIVLDNCAITVDQYALWFDVPTPFSTTFLYLDDRSSFLVRNCRLQSTFDQYSLFGLNSALTSISQRSIIKVGPNVTLKITRKSNNSANAAICVCSRSLTVTQMSNITVDDVRISAPRGIALGDLAPVGIIINPMHFESFSSLRFSNVTVSNVTAYLIQVVSPIEMKGESTMFITALRSTQLQTVVAFSDVALARSSQWALSESNIGSLRFLGVVSLTGGSGVSVTSSTFEPWANKSQNASVGICFLGGVSLFGSSNFTLRQLTVVIGDRETVDNHEQWLTVGLWFGNVSLASNDSFLSITQVDFLDSSTVPCQTVLIGFFGGLNLTQSQVGIQISYRVTVARDVFLGSSASAAVLFAEIVTLVDSAVIFENFDVKGFVGMGVSLAAPLRSWRTSILFRLCTVVVRENCAVALPMPGQLFLLSDESSITFENSTLTTLSRTNTGFPSIGPNVIQSAVGMLSKIVMINSTISFRDNVVGITDSSPQNNTVNTSLSALFINKVECWAPLTGQGSISFARNSLSALSLNVLGTCIEAWSFTMVNPTNGASRPAVPLTVYENLCNAANGLWNSSSVVLPLRVPPLIDEACNTRSDMLVVVFPPGTSALNRTYISQHCSLHSPKLSTRLLAMTSVSTSHSLSPEQGLRSSAHLSLTVSDLLSSSDRHGTFSPTAQQLPRIAVKQRLVTTVVKKAQVASALAVVAISTPLSLLAGLGAGSAMQRASLQMLLAACSFSIEDPLDLATNPTTIGFGDSSGRYVRGAVVGNVALLAGVVVVATLCSWIRSLTSLRQGREMTLWRSAASLALPGWLVAPLGFLLQPLTSVSVATVVHSSEGAGASDAALGVFGLAVSAVLCGCATWVVTAGFGAAGRPFDRRRWALWLSTSRFPAPVRALFAAVCPTVVWRDVERGSLFVKRYETVFAGKRAGRVWFAAVELWASFATGVIGGVMPPDEATCQRLLIAMCVLQVGFLVLVVALRPYSTPFDSLLSFAVAILGAVWSVVVLIPVDAAALALSAAQIWLSVLSLVLLVAQLLLSGRFARGVRRMSVLFCAGLSRFAVNETFDSSLSESGSECRPVSTISQSDRLAVLCYLVTQICSKSPSVAAAMELRTSGQKIMGKPQD